MPISYRMWIWHWTLAKAYKCDVADASLVVSTLEKIDNEMGPITGLIAVRASFVEPDCGNWWYVPPRTPASPLSNQPWNSQLRISPKYSVSTFWVYSTLLVPLPNCGSTASTTEVRSWSPLRWVPRLSTRLRPTVLWLRWVFYISNCDMLSMKVVWLVGLLQLFEGRCLKLDERSCCWMGSQRDPRKCTLPRIRSVVLRSHLVQECWTTRIVNTAQTSVMAKNIRDHQALNLPLGRFAEVRHHYFDLSLRFWTFRVICYSLMRWLDKPCSSSLSTRAIWPAASIS